MFKLDFIHYLFVCALCRGREKKKNVYSDNEYEDEGMRAGRRNILIVLVSFKCIRLRVAYFNKHQYYTS